MKWQDLKRLIERRQRDYESMGQWQDAKVWKGKAELCEVILEDMAELERAE
jgi:hypothetical protein